MAKQLKPKISDSTSKIYIDTTDKENKTVTLSKLANTSETIVEKTQGNIDIVATIHKLLTNSNLTPNDLVGIEPNPGPGSFTGVKIGVTIANVFNWANNLALKSDVVIANAPASRTGKNSYNKNAKIHYYKPMYGAEPTITPRKPN